MRPAAFLFVFGIDLSMSFVPLHTERLYVGGDWLSPEVMMGLPISAEFLFVGLAILAAGRWIDRRGWRPPFVAGVVYDRCGLYGRATVEFRTAGAETALATVRSKQGLP